MIQSDPEMSISLLPIVLYKYHRIVNPDVPQKDHRTSNPMVVEIKKDRKIVCLAGNLPAFLKNLFLSVRQKVRQFAVDTELLVTCNSTC